MPTEQLVGHLPNLAREALPHSLHNVDNFNIHIYKFKDPMPLPPPSFTSKAGGYSSSKLIHGTRSNCPPGDLLEKIKSSKNPDRIEVEGVELLYIAWKIKDCFVSSEDKIQGFIYFSDPKVTRGRGTASTPGSASTRGPASNLPSSGNTTSQDPVVRAIQAVMALSVTSDIGMNCQSIHDMTIIGRPKHHFGHPNAIFNQPLAILQYDLNTLDLVEDHEPEKKFLDVSNKFLTNMLADYPDENSRWEACRKFFTDIFGEQMPAQSVTPHGFWGCVPSVNPSPTSPFPLVILDVKNYGQPTLQHVKYYAAICSKWIKDRTLVIPTIFPVILIGLNGHSLEISSAVTLERIVVNDLLTFDLKEGLDRSNVTLRKLARIASALKKCATGLEEECKKIIPRSPSTTTPHQLFFPQPTSQPPGSTPGLPTNVIYKKRLGPSGRSFNLPKNELHPKNMRCLFTGTQDFKDVVVKFTAMYNKEAHTLLAKNDLAPKLYSCDRVIGDLFMVVMERLNGKPLASVKTLVHHSALVDITRALDILRKNNFVHGDLRAVNVMIVPDDQKRDHAKLVDFDWAGKSGIALYPWTINKADLSHEWDPDVKPGGLMQTAHDKFALGLLKPKFMPK